MNFSDKTERANFRRHLLDGAFYISSWAFLSAQTMFPALLTRMGGGNIAVGALPVIVYFAFFFPQVIAANYIGLMPVRKRWVVRLGLIQRIHIAALAAVVAIFGAWQSQVGLVLFFMVYLSNQVAAGLVSPAWYDFVAKTVSPNLRGRLMGLRTSAGAGLGFLNGILLTALLTLLPYPHNYASVIALGFCWQMASWFVQRRVEERHPSARSVPDSLPNLMSRISGILRRDRLFVRFLVASSLLTVSFTSVAFFTVFAMQQFNLTESYIGLFTTLTLGAQVISGAALGWIADRHGTTVSLRLCALALLFAIILALVGRSVLAVYGMFLLVGINLGAELITRYNFAVECAAETDRPMYVGLMNAWFAPLYLFSILAGALSNVWGYKTVFAGDLVLACLGMVLLLRLQDPRKRQLALSSK